MESDIMESIINEIKCHADATPAYEREVAILSRRLMNYIHFWDHDQDSINDIKDFIQAEFDSKSIS